MKEKVENRQMYDEEYRVIDRIMKNVDMEDEREFSRAWRRELAERSFEDTQVLLNVLRVNFAGYKVARLISSKAELDLPAPKVDSPNLYFSAYITGNKALARKLLEDYSEEIVASDQFILAFRRSNSMTAEFNVEAVCACAETSARFRSQGIGAGTQWTEDLAVSSAVLVDQAEAAGLERASLQEAIRCGLSIKKSSARKVEFVTKDVITLAKAGLRLKSARSLFEQRALSETYETIQAFQESAIDWDCVYDVLQNRHIRRAVRAGIVTNAKEVEMMMAVEDKNTMML